MRSGQGFSLVEILVVLFVIVVIAGLVSLNVNSGAGDTRLQQRLERLQSVASYALDEAQFLGQDFGVLFVSDDNDNGETTVVAHWRVRTLVGWRLPEANDELFAPIVFPESILVALALDGLATTPEDAAAAALNSNASPQWQLLSSGETQTGELILRSDSTGETLWRLKWDALGRMQQFRGDELANDAA